jgi:hypothetical protein
MLETNIICRAIYLVLLKANSLDEARSSVRTIIDEKDAALVETKFEQEKQPANKEK